MIAIVAMADNRVIGRNGGLPWHLPEDMRWFKAVTLGGTVIMGRKTFQSIGKPLYGRANVVLSRLEPPDACLGAQVVGAPEELLSDLSFLPGKHFVIGGAEIYQALMPYTNEILLTRVAGTYHGDAFFPSFEGEFRQVEVIAEKPGFRIEKWERTNTELTREPMK